jgi:DNA-binding NtrC family response regulator
VKNQSNENNFSERDLLYKILFEMKKDMSDMKQMIAILLKNSAFSNINQNEEANNMNNFSSDSPTYQYFEQSAIKPIKSTNVVNSNPIGDDRIQDITPVMEEDNSLLLDRTEKEMIIKALKKNKSKRKYAANDLGISERTLYRKIKQYDLEEM